MNALTQIAATATFRLLLAIMFEYCVVNLIAMNLWKVTNLKWTDEAVENTTIKSK